MDFKETVCYPISTVGQAAREGALDKLKELIAAGRPVDVMDNRGWRPTHESANGNHVDCLDHLLLQDVTEIGWQSFEGNTALMVACEQGNVECVKLLLDHNADPDTANNVDDFPLLGAVKSGKFECVRLLVEAGANLNSQLYCGTSALHQAASEGMVEVVKCLLEKGAKLDIREEYNITPIFSAAHHGQPECLKLLLEEAMKRGEQHLVNSPADDGGTPLYLAAQDGHTECVRILLEYGADVNALTSSKPIALPLHPAVQFQRIEILKMICSTTDKKKVSKCCLSPFEFALDHRDKGLSTKTLIEGGMDVNYRHKPDMDDYPINGVLSLTQDEPKFNKKITPLCLAAMYRNPIENVQTLIECGAKVNAEYRYDVAPLLMALESGYLDLCWLLIKNGARVNIYHPQVIGNLAVISAMQHWKGLLLVLKCNAEVGTLFTSFPAPYILPKIPPSVQKYGFVTDPGTASQQETESDSASEAESDFDKSAFDSEDEGNGSENPGATQFFEIMMTAKLHARRLRIRAPICKILHLLLQFTGNVPLDPMYEGVMDSAEEWQTIKAIEDSPRTLAHYCRLTVRNCIGTQRLMSADSIESLPLPQSVHEFLLYKELDDIT